VAEHLKPKREIMLDQPTVQLMGSSTNLASMRRSIVGDVIKREEDRFCHSTTATDIPTVRGIAAILAFLS